MRRAICATIASPSALPGVPHLQARGRD